MPKPLDSHGNTYALHDQLFEWLDSVHGQSFISSAREIARLFGELIRRQLFSYDRYIQRLISRSDQLENNPGCEVNDPESSRFVSPHSKYLLEIPLIKADSALERQRKTALFGHRSRMTEEERLEFAAQMELRQVIPYFFEGLVWILHFTKF